MGYYTGRLRNVTLCQIENTTVEFLFGYVVEHKNDKFKRVDWFVTSYIESIRKVEDHFIVKTANSLYQISNYSIVKLPIVAIDNVRTGTPP